MPALRRDDPDTWALELLNTVLGDGSSSRLFLKIREELGLAYDVHAFQTDLADTGTLQIYAGVDPGEMREALEATWASSRGCATRPFRRRSWRRPARTPRAGWSCGWRRAATSRRGSAVQEALHERVLTLDEALAALDAVTVEDVQALAGRLFRDEVLTLAVIAPARRSRTLEQAVRLP